MHILHVDPDDMDNPVSGGGPVRTFEICRRLARRHQITVLTPTFEGSTPEKWREGIRYLRLGRKIGDHGGSHHFTFMAALPKAVRSIPHDLLVEDFMPPSSATLLPLLRRRQQPMVASVQWFFARQWTQWLKLPFHWGEEYGVRLYSDFVVLTPSMKATIERRHPKARCRIIPNGVDPALFDVGTRPGGSILYMGRLQVEAKGLDLLLRAYARWPGGERPPLILAGNVQEPNELRRQLAANGLEGQVQVPGPFDAARRLRLLEDCRVLAMPSRHETFGMTIAEANAAARLAVIWDAAPMNEVASPNSPRVQPHDVDAYAQQLWRQFQRSDDDLAAEGQLARQHARRFDWDVIAADQEDFYMQAMTEWQEMRAPAASRP